jgi:hypothetical protein
MLLQQAEGGAGQMLVMKNATGAQFPKFTQTRTIANHNNVGRQGT